jgi:hypothetical protein
VTNQPLINPDVASQSLVAGDQSIRPQPVIEVTFDRPGRCYEPGGQLTATYRVLCPGVVLRALEQSVVWYTEGKGEEDLMVHRFERVTDRRLLATCPVETAFTTTLPASPLSYEGVIVKIRWCVRIRAFFQGARDFVSEHVFQVGSVPPARPHRPPPRTEPTP